MNKTVSFISFPLLVMTLLLSIIFSGINTAKAQEFSVIATIPVGDNPAAAAVNPTNGLVYVANLGSGTVSVIDPTTNTVVATIPIGDKPIDVAVNPTNGLVYVANYDANTVSVIDPTTNTVVATIPVGAFPVGVAMNPTNGLVYVISLFSDVSVIDSSTNTVVTTISVGDNPMDVAVNPTNGLVYVANSGFCIDCVSTVSVIDSSTNTVIATMPFGSSVEAIAVNPTNGLVYVASRVSGTVSVIDPTTNTVVATIPIGDAPRGVAVNPTNGLVYVVSSSVYVIDPSTNTVVASIPVGGVGVAVNPTNGLVYVASGGNTVSVISTVSQPPKDTTPPTITVPSSLIVVIAPSQSPGTVVTYTATATDDVDGTITPTCNPPSGSTFPIGDTIVTCTAIDKAGNTATPATFVVRVLSPAQAIQQQLVDLAQSIGVNIGPLHQAVDLISDNNPNNDVAVCNKLDAFINQVNTNQQQQQGQIITPEQASQLIQSAQSIKTSIGCT
jgi:YVTN family beta-propeller protein